MRGGSNALPLRIRRAQFGSARAPVEQSEKSYTSSSSLGGAAPSRAQEAAPWWRLDVMLPSDNRCGACKQCGGRTGRPGGSTTPSCARALRCPRSQLPTYARAAPRHSSTPAPVRPRDSHRRYINWWMFTVFCSFLTAILVPFHIAFSATPGLGCAALAGGSARTRFPGNQRPPPPSLLTPLRARSPGTNMFFLVMEVLLDSIFLLDVLLHLTSVATFAEDGLVVTQRRDIAKAYSRRMLVPDLLFAIPWDQFVLLAAGLESSDSKKALLLSLLGFIKLVSSLLPSERRQPLGGLEQPQNGWPSARGACAQGRLYRLVHWFAYLGHNMLLSQLVLMMLRNQTYLFLLLHIAACLLYFIARCATPRSRCTDTHDLCGPCMRQPHTHTHTRVRSGSATLPSTTAGSAGPSTALRTSRPGSGAPCFLASRALRAAAERHPHHCKRCWAAAQIRLLLLLLHLDIHGCGSAPVAACAPVAARRLPQHMRGHDVTRRPGRQRLWHVERGRERLHDPLHVAQRGGGRLHPRCACLHHVRLTAQAPHSLSTKLRAPPRLQARCPCSWCWRTSAPRSTATA